MLMPLMLGGCPEDPPAPRTVPASSDADVAADKPVTQQALGPIKRACAAAVRLKQGIAAGEPKRADYLELRQHVAATRPYFRLRAQMGAEVLLGPPRSIDEGGGMLGLLDAALASGDLKAADEPMQQVVRALRLIDHELSLHGVPPRDAVRALSDAAYELGLVLIEADALVAAEPDAVLADARGLLSGIESGALALGSLNRKQAVSEAFDALKQVVKAIRRELDQVKHAHELRGRLHLVRKTAALGVAARRYALTLGEKPRLPYPARYPVRDNGADEPVSALTVPAPRRDPRSGDPEAMAQLGLELFFDRALSKNNKRSCSDCHRPNHGFSDGLPTPPSLLAGVPIRRNTPTLLYTSLHASQLWDGQIVSAESQALKVIHTATEMGLTTDQELVDAVAAGYRDRFVAVFDDGVTVANVARAIVAFEVRHLVPATSPIDRFARGEVEALSPKQEAGFDVFVGVGRCARCHIPPLFGGSRPTDFAVPIYAALGVTRSPDGSQLDPDLGRGKVTKRPIDGHAFKTPTVRNVDRTGPFFHNGAFAALEQVVDFYDDGGGRGRGAKLDNQDPDVRKLKLGQDRKRQLLVFMREALRDPEMPALKR